MIAIIFEVIPKPDKAADYFAEAASLKAELEVMPGFISVERFESIASKGKFLSLSFWADEAAVANWRNHQHHRQTQARGRSGVFQDYRLRVASVIRDYGMFDRVQAPEDSVLRHS
jgi:heme-degrading monooxygenase HmoA